MTQSPDEQEQKHPNVTEHPEQRRQEQTGKEDASDATEVGRAPSSREERNKSEHAA